MRGALRCLSADDVKTLRERLGLSQAKFAKLIGTDIRSISRWETGKSTPTGPAEEVLRGIARAMRKNQSLIPAISGSSRVSKAEGWMIVGTGLGTDPRSRARP